MSDSRGSSSRGPRRSQTQRNGKVAPHPHRMEIRTSQINMRFNPLARGLGWIHSVPIKFTFLIKTKTNFLFLQPLRQWWNIYFCLTKIQTVMWPNMTRKWPSCDKPSENAENWDHLCNLMFSHSTLSVKSQKKRKENFRCTGVDKDRELFSQLLSFMR